MSVVNPAATGIGTLPRLIEEQNQQNLLGQRPSAMPASPLRSLVRTTLLSPLSPGTSRIVSQAGEPIVPTTDTTAGAGMTPGVNNGFVGGVPGGTSPSIGSSQGGSQYGIQMSAPTGQPRVQGASTGAGYSAPRATSQSILGRSNVGPSSAGNKTATPVDEMNVAVPSGVKEFGSNAAFQKAQTPEQNILGGIGKYGTMITSALKLPQLIPGGAFKALQNAMAPTINRLIPNFNARIA